MRVAIEDLESRNLDQNFTTVPAVLCANMSSTVLIREQSCAATPTGRSYLSPNVSIAETLEFATKARSFKFKLITSCAKAFCWTTDARYTMSAFWHHRTASRCVPRHEIWAT